MLPSVLCLLSLAVPEAGAPAPKAPLLKVRLEVGKKIARYFEIKDGKVLLKNGVEITLLRGCKVELTAVDRNLSFPDQKPKLPADVVLFQVQQTSQFPAMLAAVPAFPGPNGKKLGLHVPYVDFTFAGPGGPRGVQTQTNLQNPPTEADWEKLRLAALTGMDAILRQQLGESLLQPARLVFHDKPGWYVENPYPFVIAGKAELLGPDKRGRLVPFRLEPGAARLWIDGDRFLVRDLAIAAPLPKKK